MQEQPRIQTIRSSTRMTVADLDSSQNDKHDRRLSLLMSLKEANRRKETLSSTAKTLSSSFTYEWMMKEMDGIKIMYEAREHSLHSYYKQIIEDIQQKHEDERKYWGGTENELKKKVKDLKRESEKLKKMAQRAQSENKKKSVKIEIENLIEMNKRHEQKEKFLEDEISLLKRQLGLLPNNNHKEAPKTKTNLEELLQRLQIANLNSRQ